MELRVSSRLAAASVLLSGTLAVAENASVRVTVTPRSFDWPHSPVVVRLDSVLKAKGWETPFSQSAISVTDVGTGQVVPSRPGWGPEGEDAGQVLFQKTGPGRRTYEISVGPAGRTAEPKRIPVVGLGEPLTHGVSGMVSGIDGSFNSHVAVVDQDGDGDVDLVVAQGQGGGATWTMHGTLFFENIGTPSEPLFGKPRFLVSSTSQPHVIDWDGDGHPDLLAGNRLYRGFGTGAGCDDANAQVLQGLPPVSTLADFDGDGFFDIVQSVSTGGGDPSPAIWSRREPVPPFTSEGVWRGYTGRGRVIVHRNRGTRTLPRFDAAAETLRVGSEWLDVPGGGTPAFGDLDGDGDEDLLLGTTHDLFFFENKGTRREPTYARGVPLDVRLEEIYIRPAVADMNGDGKLDVLIAQENGDIKLVRNLGRQPGRQLQFGPVTRLRQLDPFMDLGSVGAFDIADVNRDSLPDIVGSNSYGEVWQWLSVSGASPWVFEAGTRVSAAGEPIRIFAGASGSIQGPGEARYGYGAPELGDWNGDGAVDMVLTDVWGKHRFYAGERRGPGSPQGLDLAAEVPARFADPRDAVKPAWNWWDPLDGELVTQWRTRGELIDWTGNGQLDYVAIDHEGYLGLFPGIRSARGMSVGRLERVFLNAGGGALFLTPGKCGQSGRYKIAMADWDGDGDLDLIRGVAAPSGNTMHTGTEETGCAFFFENVGSNRFAFRKELVPDSTIRLAGHSACPQPYDFDGDGRLDLLIGAEDGHIYAFHRAYLENDLPRVTVSRTRVRH